MKITLKNLHEATEQQVFDQVKEHLLTQREKSFEEDNDLCRYRVGKLKCAAGCLIGDDEYNEDAEYNSWNSLAREGIVPSAHSGLIEELQLVHDNESVDDWGDALKDVAFKWNLKF